MAKMGRPKSQNTKKKVLSIRVPDELYSTMLEYAEKNKLSITEVVLRGVNALIMKDQGQ